MVAWKRGWLVALLVVLAGCGSAMIRGQVVDVEGKPLNAVEVNLVDGSGAVLSTGLTTGTGEFELPSPDGVPQGTSLELRFKGEGVAPTSQPHVTGTERLHNVQMTREALVRGEVLDTNGAPLRLVWVHAHRESGQIANSTQTDPSGRFVLKGLPEGEYYLSLRHSNYRTAKTTAFHLRSGEKRDFFGKELRLTADVGLGDPSEPEGEDLIEVSPEGSPMQDP